MGPVVGTRGRPLPLWRSLEVGEVFARLPFWLEVVTESEEVAVVVPMVRPSILPSGSDPETELGPLNPLALLL
jgi:hypothetical protein